MNNISETILQTKIRIPGNHPYIIERKRIYKEFKKSLMCKITVINASTGYGKTTAVFSWLKNLEIPTAWISLDTGDNNPIVFWHYIFAALNEAIEDFTLPYSVLQHKEYFDSKIYLNILINRLSEVKGNVILTIDDFHLINQSEIHDDLAFLVNYLPDNIHIILITRTLSGTIYKKVRFFEKMMIITSKILRFEKDEIYMFYKSRGMILGKDELTRIESCTEGWAIALVAEYSNKTIYRESYSLISKYKGYDVLLEEYICEEFHSTWSAEQQSFMIRTSVLDRFCSSLCDRVTNSNTKDMLIYLYQHNSFLAHADGEDLWFRYHNHYSDFLRKELALKYAEELPVLHRRAGNWYEEAGFLSEAVTHYMKGAYYEGIILLIYKHGESMVRSGEYLLLISWVDMLPEDIIVNNFDLCIIMALKSIGNRDFGKGDAYLERMKSIMDNASDTRENIIRKTKLMLIKIYFKALLGGDR